MNQPKITIVVPTRERADVLGASLRTVAALNYDNLDILVSDNFSTDATAEVVRSVGDPRLRYINTGRRLSMSHNWEFALSHVPVDDRYVMIIGDDDGIVPGALERIASIVRETGAKAVNSTFVTFIWPSAENAGMGRLLVPMRSGFELRSTRQWLRRALQGRAWYSELPMLYAGGAIHMSLVAKVRQQNGRMFRSCIPDVFSAIALSSVVDRYVFSNEPFAIAGHSRHSNGAAWNAASTGVGSEDVIRPKQLFSSEANIPWHGDIPTFPDGSIPFSVDLLAYESYLQSKYLHNDVLRIERSDMLAQFAARRIPDKLRMDTWLKLFAKQHGIDIAAVRRKTSFLSLRMRWDLMLEYAVAFRDIYRLEPSFGVKMRDVHEASIVAATLLVTRPSRLRSYVGTISKHLGLRHQK